MCHHGTIIRIIRQARGVSHADVGRRLGHRGKRRGERRIRTIEATGRVSANMLERLLEALEVERWQFEILVAEAVRWMARREEGRIQSCRACKFEFKKSKSA